MNRLRQTKERVLGFLLAFMMTVSVVVGGNMFEVKAEASSRTLIDSVTLEFDWKKFKVSELEPSSENYQFWVTMTGTGVKQTEDPDRYIMVKPTQAHVDAGYISADVLANVGNNGWVSYWLYDNGYEIGANDEIGYDLRIHAEDGYSFSETTSIQLKGDNVTFESKMIQDSPFYDDGNNDYLTVILNLGTGADIGEAINSSTQEPVTPPGESFLFQVYEYYEFQDDCVFEYFVYDDNAEEWRECNQGGFMTSLVLGQKIGEQLSRTLKIEENPTRQGSSFEGWARFQFVDDEDGSQTRIFMPKSDTDLYYTTDQIFEMEMPNYNVCFVPKWSDISIEDYYRVYTEEEEYFFDILGYGDNCIFKYLHYEYNEDGEGEWVEYDFGGFGTTLYAGKRIGLQISDGFKIETDPTRKGATFEGWAKFKTERDENGHVRETFVPQSEAKSYYTTDEMLNSEMPNYNVTFYPKWSDISIEDYYQGYTDEGGNVTPPTEEENKNDYSAKLENESDVKTKIELTEDEKSAIASGEELEVVLLFTDIGAKIDNDEKKAIEKQLGTNKLGTFLDIELIKKIGSTEVEVSETTGLITITFEMPEELKNKDTSIVRTYKVMRYHDGKVDVLDARYDAKTGKLSFETDKFSTYAVVYSDAKVSDTTTPAPQTGDTTNTFVYIALLGLAFCSVLVVLRKQGKLQ